MGQSRGQLDCWAVVTMANTKWPLHF